MGSRSNQEILEEDSMANEDVSNDDPVENETWFSMEMTREVKLEAHLP